MSKYVNIKNLSISFKIGLSLFLLGIILLTTLFILITPKIDEEQFKNESKQLEKMINLTNQQIKLVVNYFRDYSNFERLKAKTEIENIIDKVKLKKEISKDYSIEKIYTDLQEIEKKYNCQVKIENNTYMNSLSQNNWLNEDTEKNICPHKTYYKFNTLINPSYNLNIKCESEFYKESKNIELDVKKIVQEGFSLTKNLHKGKIYLIWIDNKIEKADFSKRINELSNKKNEFYCVSKISNFRTPKSGNLTVGDFLEVSNTKLINHKLDNKDTMTWISRIYEDKKENFYLVLSVYDEDFKNNIQNPILNLLPISIFALIISSILGMFIFRNWLRKINKLSLIAKKINRGNLNVRSNIKGNDDLGVLGSTFDSMLDSLEDNIQNLDLKVKERTVELEKLLDSKELLLKELNHRVKNNLFLIINFIKLQKNKTTDKQIKVALEKIENRIHSISLVHSKLFQENSIELINSKEYFLQLIKDLKNSFEENKDFSINCSIQNLNLSVENSMYCGIILNELITNSVKYSNTNKHTIIDIEIYTSNKIDYIILKDNGIGLKKDFITNTYETLGLKLVDTIVKNQLKGDLNIQNYPLEIIIKFPI